MENTFTLGSCHTVGLKWNVGSPIGLDKEDIQQVCDLLVDWTDQPSQDTLNEMLEDGWVFTSGKLSDSKKELYGKIAIYTSTVHREFWTQDFQAN